MIQKMDESGGGLPLKHPYSNEYPNELIMNGMDSVEMSTNRNDEVDRGKEDTDKSHNRELKADVNSFCDSGNIQKSFHAEVNSQLENYFEEDQRELNDATSLTTDGEYLTLKLKQKNSKKVQKILGHQVHELKTLEKDINKLKGLLRRGKLGEYMPIGAGQIGRGGPTISKGERVERRNTISERMAADFNSQEDEYNGSPTATNLAIS